jgi:hypothetical protein
MINIHICAGKHIIAEVKLVVKSGSDEMSIKSPATGFQCCIQNDL